ncbi:hypothetical protein SCHPADRAFT_127456 [Schizopora paradoxa]|uniref:Uncharacterized protein n=1 Tax=Schizopora paradoxa TaxID=27342 RepID=A0A0H2SME4_9AGAM|nr:hypothetical protein SCHPADRAFT_127456 [Schizopora paradoxa]
MPLGRCKRRLKRLLRRPPLARVPEAESVTEPDSNATQRSRQIERTKSRWKRAALAVAAHGFDVLQQVSDLFGPLKAVVSLVGYTKNVWQNSDEIVKQARELKSDVQAFHDQVANGPGCNLSAIQVKIMPSLIELDR